MPAWFGGEPRGKEPGLPGTSPRGLPREGVSNRIDLGARLGPALTACIGVTTRGVRASHAMHKVPQDDNAGYGRSSVTTLTIAASSPAKLECKNRWKFGERRDDGWRGAKVLGTQGRLV
jgi:hypothetical protein